MRRRTLRRRQRHCANALVLVLLSTAWLATDRAAAQESPFLLGGDISALSVIEEHGGEFHQNGETCDLVELMGEYGCNCMRLRLFVKPNYRDVVVNDLPYTLALAKRVKQTGQQLILNFHYSDTWADPGKQFKPADWSNLSLEELEQTVEDYTATTIQAFKDAGVLPDIVQVGNEITPGMLWPEGKLAAASASDQQKEQQWDAFTRLVAAGIRGVEKPLDENDQVKVMIHIDRGGDWPTTKWFFDNFVKRNVRFDLIGQSYYPWWHGTLDDVRENLRQTAETYGKPIAIVETSYPYRDDHSWDDTSNMSWPISPEGQAQFVEDLIAVVKETPHGLGAGVVYWYPESIQVDGLHVWHGGSVALFDQKGEPLPALEVFKKHSPAGD